MSTRSIVFLDTETTGLDPDRHEIWQIAYSVDGDDPIQFEVPHSLRNADPVALSMNHYWEVTITPSNELGPKREDELKAALKGATLCCANPAFDSTFLKARWGIAPWHHRLLDIQAYAAPAMNRQGNNLPSMREIAEHFKVTTQPDHSAINDVRALVQAYNKITNYYISTNYLHVRDERLTHE